MRAVDTAHGHAPARRADESEHRADQRRLAHAVATEQADRLAGPDGEAHALQHMAFAIERVDGIRLEQRLDGGLTRGHRSEERRVGNEWRVWWARGEMKK